MKVVIALGGNALLMRGEPLEAAVQRVNVARAADVIAAIAQKHTVVVTHGNGPQVGLLSLQSEAYGAVSPYPLDILGAESEGMIGYLIEVELENRLPKRQIVTLLTQIEVNLKDPAFKNPSKPIGPAFGEQDAKRLAHERGWTVAPDGRHWRRVVASPEPIRIRELAAIRLLVASGAVVVCAGGGGIPVAVSPEGMVKGVEAVIDKDLAAALLAHQIGADALLLLTDTDAVYLNWGGARPLPIHETLPEELRKHAFAPGSMRPKVEAACRFIESGGKIAGIGRLEDAASILEGMRGTVVRPKGFTLDFTTHAPAATPPAKPVPPQQPGAPAAVPPAKQVPPQQAGAPAWVPFELPENAPYPSPDLKPRAPLKK